MIYIEHDGVKRLCVEVCDVPEFLRGLGELLFMTQGADISIEDRSLHLLDYICESIASDIDADLKRRGIRG